jgi:hypothetical protein
LHHFRRALYEIKLGLHDFSGGMNILQLTSHVLPVSVFKNSLWDTIKVNLVKGESSYERPY